MMKRTWCIIVAVALLGLGATALPPTTADASGPIEDGGRIPDDAGDGFANFRTFCEFSHASYDDPIVHPGDPGAAHLHFFFGNTKADAFSTPERLRTSGRSTCQGGNNNRSAYWMPALFDATGRPMIPDGNNVYYKHLTSEDPADTQVLPADLRMVAGNADGTPESADYDVVHWNCASGGGRSDTIPNCGRHDELQMRVDFPNCWDGENLDAPDHMSHMAWAELRDGGVYCPASHPVAVPQILLLFSWELRDSSSDGWYLSSDMGRPAGSTLHADWMNGWKPRILDRWTRECIQAARDCISGELGDGTKLEATLAMGSRAIPLPHHPDRPGSRYCNGRVATIVGTNNDDVLIGTSGDDVIVGLKGDDTIEGRGGNDIICGYGGNDTLDGGPGDDELYGGWGQDRLFGRAGADFMRGDQEDDYLEGDLGDDTMNGGSGDDTLVEFGDRNLLFGGSGNDDITGGWWIDIIYGGSGDDVITGTGGPDRIHGGSGTDRCEKADEIKRCEG